MNDIDPTIKNEQEDPVSKVVELINNAAGNEPAEIGDEETGYVVVHEVMTREQLEQIVQSRALEIDKALDNKNHRVGMRPGEPITIILGESLEQLGVNRADREVFKAKEALVSPIVDELELIFYRELRGTRNRGGEGGYTLVVDGNFREGDVLRLVEELRLAQVKTLNEVHRKYTEAKAIREMNDKLRAAGREAGTMAKAGVDKIRARLTKGDKANK